MGLLAYARKAAAKAKLCYEKSKLKIDIDYKVSLTKMSEQKDKTENLALEDDKSNNKRKIEEVDPKQQSIANMFRKNSGPPIRFQP